MGTPSAYREAAKLAAESAALASRRASIARDTASAVEGGVATEVLSGMLKHLAEEECNARSLCVKARLRSGDAAAALSEADLAVAAAERTEDLPHLVDSVVMRGTALLHVRGPQAAMDEHERALRLCKDSPWRGAPSASACDTDGVAARRHDARRMLGAEASARSNLARDLHGMDRVDEALALQERAVTLRREADGDAAADGEASAGERGELRRALGQTLCNYGIMLGGAADAATPDRLQQGRALLEEARQLALATGDKGLEQTALINLTNLASSNGLPSSLEGAGATDGGARDDAQGSEGSEGGDTHLKQLRHVMEQTGRSTSVTCVVCLEDLGDTASELCSTHCGHMFHRACLSKWLQRSDKCPSCQASLMRP